MFRGPQNPGGWFNSAGRVYGPNCLKSAPYAAKIMKISKETSLYSFEFWSGAKEFAQNLTEQELTTIERNLKDLYPNGIDETELNDLFWFDREMICEWIGATDAPR